MKLPVLGFFFLAVPLAPAGPLLKNGGFDAKEPAPWECEEGKLARDGDNPVLEISLDGGVFGLAQDFQWPAEKGKLTLTFRVKADQATKESPVQLRARLFDKEGNSEIVATATVKESGKWITVKAMVARPDTETVSFLLESNRGQGTLWIDDVALE